MISRETATKIAWTHQEIENSQKLINDMAEVLQKDEDKTFPEIRNAFGEKRGLELGVPSGNNGHRIFNVPPALSMKIIEAHIEAKKKRLEELMAIAKIELSATNQ